jgi:hypothetical protein
MVTNGSEAAAWGKAEENFDFLSREAPWETLLDHQDIAPGGDPVSTNTAFDQWYNDLIPSDSTDNKISATDFEWPSTVNLFELTLKEMPVSPMSKAAKSSITLYQTKRLDDEKYFLGGIKGMKCPRRLARKRAERNGDLEASYAESSVFACQLPTCQFNSTIRDEYKQHMERVHGWIYVKANPLDDLYAPRPVVPDASATTLGGEEGPDSFTSLLRDCKVDLLECSQMPKESSHPPQDDMHENSQPSAKQLPISPSPSELENEPPTVPEPPNSGSEWQQNLPTTVLTRRQIQLKSMTVRSIFG